MAGGLSRESERTGGEGGMRMTAKVNAAETGLGENN